MALYKNRFENLEDKHNTIYNDKNQKTIQIKFIYRIHALKSLLKKVGF